MEHELEASRTVVVGELPAAPGAYALLIELDREVPLPAGFEGLLPPGRYAYLGNARGPGGIRARVTRHLGASRRRHWHVDWLTPAAVRLTALALPDGDECELVRRLLSVSCITVPVPGFGSSDCRRCPAHLVALDATIPERALAATDRLGRDRSPADWWP